MHNILASHRATVAKFDRVNEMEGKTQRRSAVAKKDGRKEGRKEGRRINMGINGSGHNG